jgi:hypothetical protein
VIDKYKKTEETARTLQGEVDALSFAIGDRHVRFRAHGERRLLHFICLPAGNFVTLPILPSDAGTRVLPVIWAFVLFNIVAPMSLLEVGLIVRVTAVALSFGGAIAIESHNLLRCTISI